MKSEFNLSQEGLKLIACVAMLLDHIATGLIPEATMLNIIGRLAFPIYCFLLVEGICHSKSPQKYALRLAFGALISEIPYDLFNYGTITSSHYSVMVTLLIGFLMMAWMKYAQQYFLPLVICFTVAELMGAEYGGCGILLIATFFFTRTIPHPHIIQAVAMGILFAALNTLPVHFLKWSIPIQIFGVLSIIPISMYQGRKSSHNKVMQWSFYLFYPLHLILLLATKAIRLQNL